MLNALTVDQVLRLRSPRKNMQICLISDTHSEFHHYQTLIDVMLQTWKGTDNTIIVAAGDIDQGSRGAKMLIDYFPNNQIIYVSGNHEYYYNKISKVNAELDALEYSYENFFHLSEGKYLPNVGGIDFVGTTNWPAIPQELMDYCLVSLNDYRLISDLQITDHSFKENTTQFLESISGCMTDSLPKVLVTHFIPHRKCTAARWNKPEYEKINNYFVSAIDDDILNEYDLVLFGHGHDPIDIVDNGTRFVSNPRGYPNEHGFYNTWQPKYINFDR